jgi:hypothetical protein
VSEGKWLGIAVVAAALITGSLSEPDHDDVRPRRLTQHECVGTCPEWFSPVTTWSTPAKMPRIGGAIGVVPRPDVAYYDGSQLRGTETP